MLPFLEFLENELGLKIETLKLPRADAFRQMEDGTIDMLGMVGLDFGPDKNFLTIPSLFRTEGAVISHRDEPIHSVLGLQGKRIGVLENTMIRQTAEQYAGPKGRVLEFTSLDEMLDALEKKQIDCFAVVNFVLTEILNRPFTQYNFNLPNYSLEMGFLSGRKEMQPLFDLVCRFFKSSQGEYLKKRIAQQRDETIIQLLQEHLKEDIEYLHRHYDLIKLFDSGVLYPHCFQKGKEKQGILVEICDLFTRLTGLPYEIGEWSCGDAGLPAALEKIRNGECHFTSGSYSNIRQWENDGFSYSVPVCQDTIRPYSFKRNIDVFNNVRIACPPNVVPFFQWKLISNQPIQVSKTRRGLFDALKKNECDVIFVGEMNFNYRSVVLNKYDLYENDELSAEAEMRLISGPQHPQLNRLMDKAIQMYPVLFPKAIGQWKEQAERNKIDLIRYQKTANRIYLYVGILVLCLMAIILLLLRHFMKYDRQIRKLIKKQQTFDLAWGNLRNKRLTSKGDHPLFTKWGFIFSGPTCSFDELSEVFHTDRFKEFQTAMNRMKKENTNLCIMDMNVVSPADGKQKYFRRFIHRLGNHRFMLCSQDTTAQVEAEQQEQFLVELFEVMKEGFLFLDNDLNVLRYSKSIKDLFPDFDLTKKHCYQVFRNRTAPCGDCPIQKSLKDGKKYSKIEYIESSGKWVEISSYPIADPNTGEINRVLEFLYDITEQHDREETLQQQKRFLEAIFNASNDGIMAADPDNPEDTLVNSRMRTMFKNWELSFFNITDEKNFQRYKEIAKNPEEILDAAEQLKTNPLREQEGILYFYDGRIVQWRGVAVETGMGKNGWTQLWTIQDITEKHRSAEKIRESEERFRQLYTSMSNALVLLDVVREESGQAVDFIINSANPAFDNYLIDKPKELKGLSFLELCKPYGIETVGSDGEWWGGIRLAADGSGGTYHCVFHSYPSAPYHEVVVFPCGEGQVGVLLYDETYRIRLQESFETTQVIIDQLSEPVFQINMDGTIQYVNIAAADMLGYDNCGVEPDGPVGEKIWKFDPELSETEWSEIEKHFETNSTLHRDAKIRTKSGRIIPGIAMLDLIKQKDNSFLAACFHNLSEQTRRIEAEQSALAKDKFLDRVSQEIRTPITGIVGVANILLTTDLERKQQDYVNLVRSSGLHLLSLVNKILDFSKINSGEIEFNYSEFDLFELVDSVLGARAFQALKQNLELFAIFRGSIPGHLVGDADRLREILLFLFDNALQYTRQGGIKLTISLDRDEEQRPVTHREKTWQYFRFEVEDTGIGISQEMVDRISNQPMIEGLSESGIDLLLRRDLVELMGGKIGLKSRKSVNGKGGWSNFWFTLPLHFNENETDEDSSIEPGQFPKRFSDDVSLFFAVGNAWLREVVVEQFESYDMEIRIFSSVSATLKAMRQDVQQGKLKQVLLVDTELEDGDAMDLINQVRDDFLLEETRILLLFPVKEDPDKIERLKEKVDQLIGKPICGPILVETVFRVIEKSLWDDSDNFRRNRTQNKTNDSAEHLDPFEKQREKWSRLSDSGTEIYRTDELYRNETSAGQNNEIQSPNEGPRIILVVEDHHVNRIVAGEVLKQAGYRFEFAENGFQACNAVISKKFALILMDCQMPVMDGFEATRKIRIMESGLDEQKPKHSGRIPIIALTGNAKKDDEKRCFEVGMDAFCEKPIDAAKLTDIIHQWLPEANSEKPNSDQ